MDKRRRDMQGELPQDIRAKGTHLTKDSNRTEIPELRGMSAHHQLVPRAMAWEVHHRPRV